MGLLAEKGFVFIVGSPRSGTSWLMSRLSEHPDVASLGVVELRHWNAYIGPLLHSWKVEKQHIENNHWIQGLPHVWKQQDFDQLISTFTEKVYSRVLERNPGASMILDKHPAYVFHMSDIQRVIPNAKFIHMLRDGREVVVSMMNAREKVGFGHKSLSNAVNLWKSSVLAAQEFANKSAENYLEVRYEQMREDTCASLARILRFCNLNADEETLRTLIEGQSSGPSSIGKPNTSIDHLRGTKDAIWLNSLSSKETVLFNELAGDLLVDLGYAERGWYRKKSNVISRNFYRAKCKLVSAGKMVAKRLYKNLK